MDSLIEYFPLLLQGLWTTLKLAISTVVVGLALGMLLAMAKLSKNGWLRRPAYAFTNFMRGIPEFLVLLVIYFGGTQVLSAIVPGGAIEVSPFVAGLTALSLIFGAYASETLRGAIEAVPRGQFEAGYATNMSYVTIMRRIVLPQAFRSAFPALFNTLISLVKDTSLAANITVVEMFMTAQRITAVYYEPLALYLEVGVIYLLFCTVLTWVQHWCERRLAAHS